MRGLRSKIKEVRPRGWHLDGRSTGERWQSVGVEAGIFQWDGN